MTPLRTSVSVTVTHSMTCDVKQILCESSETETETETETGCTELNMFFVDCCQYE